MTESGRGKKRDMSIHKQRLAELNQKWNEDEKEKLDSKEWGEVFLQDNCQEEESSWGNLGGGLYRERRDGQEPEGKSKSETEQMLPNVLGKENIVVES